MRKRYEEGFKAKVALEASRDGAKISEVAAKCGVHPNKVTEWKKHLLQNAASLFAKPNNKEEKEREAREDEFLKLIGEKDLEINWLKKNLKKLNLL